MVLAQVMGKGFEALSEGVWRLGWWVVERFIPLYTDCSSIDHRNRVMWRDELWYRRVFFSELGWMRMVRREYG